MNAAPHPAEIGGYRVLARVAFGGMAEVLRAEPLEPGGVEVAIKRLLPHLACEPLLRGAITDEGRILAALSHPNVVGFRDLGIADGAEFLALELLEGQTLSSLARALRARGRELSVGLAVHLVAEACAGLHAAHELRGDDGGLLGVVHRDVSPQNLFVTTDGALKVIDFGVAESRDRTVRTGMGIAKGKLAYMAPEQLFDAKTDRRTDVFALGVVLHELATGRRLFVREHDVSVVRAVLEEPIPPPSSVAPERRLAWLDAICMRALARDPDARFESAEALAGALREAAAAALGVEPGREALRALVADARAPEAAPPPQPAIPRGHTPPLRGPAGDATTMPEIEIPTVRFPVPARARPLALGSPFGASMLCLLAIAALVTLLRTISVP